MLPFHRAIVEDPAFAPAGDEPFSIYTRWIETEFDNTIEAWSGEPGAIDGPAARQSVVVEVDGRRVEVTLPGDLVGSGPARGPAAAAPKRRGSASVSTVTGDSVTAPMQATIVKVAVAEGDTVVTGDLVVVLEAMKMEQPLTAHKDGVVRSLNAEPGTTVSSGHVLCSIS